MEATIPLGPLGGSTGIVILVLAVLGVAFFSSSEAAIISVNKIRIRSLAEKGDPAAKAVQRLFAKHDRLFGTILMLENFLIIIASSIFTVLATAFFELNYPEHKEIAILAASLMMTVIIVLFSEITPKTFAAQNAERYSLWVARPMELIVALAWPVVWVFTSITNGVLALINTLFRRNLTLATPYVTEDEIRMLLDVSQEEGQLEEEETEMMRSIMDLDQTTAREIMVPRIDIVTLSEDATFDEAIMVALKEGHSRIPVYRESSDNIIGVLYVKDLLAFLQADERPRQLPSAYIRKAYYVPESKRVDELLTEMRREKIHMAIVMDEYGGTAGLVTIEDILEEIVGEIQDEYDAEEALPVQHQSDGSVLIDGRLSIYEVNELLDVNLPTEEFDTIGGFVVGLMGRPPAMGEEVAFETLRLVAEQVEQRRLVQVRIIRDLSLQEAERGQEKQET